jgi:protein O-mannosyl-transferase
VNCSEPANSSRSHAESLGYTQSGHRVTSILAFVLVLVTFFMIAAAIHSPGFFSPMIYDSEGWIYRKADVFERGSLFAVIGIVPVRPLFMASLYLNYVTNGMEPLWFRVFNALILAITGLALAWMIVRLLEIPRLLVPGTFWEKRVVALGLALLFVVHPLQTFVVLYIWQRAAIMACLFLFSALALFIAARSGRWTKPVPAFGAVAILFFCGLMSKEHVATFPVILLAAELMLFPEGIEKILKKTVFIAEVTAPPLLLYFLLTHLFHGQDSLVPASILDRLQGFYQLGGLSLYQVILTECRVFFSYLMMMVMPFWHAMQLLQPQVISVSLWDPPVTAAAVAGVIALLGLAIRLSGTKPLISFGIFFAVITVAPESLLIPQYLFFAHRAILPMAGVTIVGAVAALYALQWGRERSAGMILKPCLAALLVAAVVSLASLTVSQAKHWSPIEFWKAAYAHLPRTAARVEKTPLEAIPVNLGAVLIDAGDYSAAAEVLRQASRLDPESPMVLLNLGQALCRSGEIPEGAEILTALVQKYPHMTPAWTILAQALFDEDKIAEGVDCLRKAVALNRGDVVLRTKLAAALIDSGDVSEAIELLNKVLEEYPTNLAGHVRMGFAMSKAGNLRGAESHFSIALRIDPGSAAALQGLILTQKQMREAHTDEDSAATTRDKE